LSKKTVATIISSGNNYVIGVKGNQANLCKQIEKIIAENSPLDVDYTLEKNKGRIEERIAMIYPPDGIDKKEWIGLKQIVHITRLVKHNDGRNTKEEAFFIDSSAKNAAQLNKGIREHWFIENTLHWTKDVTFKEDASKINKGQAPQNISLIKNWVMAIFRKNKFNSMAQAIRMVSNDLGLMVNLLE
jgi:predicted transposase YbfD/YdcC